MPDSDSEQSPAAAKESLPVLDYRRGRDDWWARLTPEQQSRILQKWMLYVRAAEFVWCVAMFLAREPGLHYFCICAFIPPGLAFMWVFLGSQMLMLVRRVPRPRRKRIVVLALLAFILAPYSLMRAGNDMFTLSVRYQLWRAGGADKVRAAFNKWLASRPVEDPNGDRRLLFGDMMPNRTVVPVPVGQLPKEVLYMHQQFPSHFGMSWKGVADLDNVGGLLTMTDIQIGPPGWQPQGQQNILGYLIGNRHKLADGIWVEFGLYDK